MSIILILVALFGLALVLAGVFFHVKRKKLNSDPVLITACYVWGGLNVATCLM